MNARIQDHTVVKVMAQANQRYDWGITLLNAKEAWKTSKGKNVKVAVLDTGIDSSHADLLPNFKGGVNFTTNDRYDFIDRQGHGTHCAGIIGAADNELGVVGVAPEVSLYSVKVLGDNGAGDLNWIIDGIDWCIQNGIDVISMSLGIEVPPPPSFHAAIKRAFTAGIAIVVAAGNEKHHLDWPAAYPETIAVGAIDSRKGVADFSNFGTGLDVAAPGVDILSTYPVGQYATLSGTSMATPYVAGAIALYIAHKRATHSAYSINDVHAAVEDTAQDIGLIGYDPSSGYGVIDLVKLLNP